MEHLIPNVGVTENQLLVGNFWSSKFEFGTNQPLTGSYEVNDGYIFGDLTLTNYRMLFQPVDCSIPIMNVPYHLVYSFTKIGGRKTATLRKQYQLVIRLKTPVTIRLAFDPRVQSRARVSKAIRRIGFAPTLQPTAFSVVHRKALDQPDSKCYNPFPELIRQGVLYPEDLGPLLSYYNAVFLNRDPISRAPRAKPIAYDLLSRLNACTDGSPPPAPAVRGTTQPAGKFIRGPDSKSGWRVTFLNTDYQMSPTYPAVLVVPNSITDEDVLGAAAFRSKGRIPMLSYRHPTGVTLSRSAQPLSGMTTRSPADEKLIDLMRTTPPQCDRLYIFDCRPRLNAMANQMAGKGTEGMFYGSSRVRYLNIANIHAVRNSYLQMCEVMRDAPSTLSVLERPLLVTNEDMIRPKPDSQLRSTLNTAVSSAMSLFKAKERKDERPTARLGQSRSQSKLGSTSSVQPSQLDGDEFKSRFQELKAMFEQRQPASSPSDSRSGSVSGQTMTRVDSGMANGGSDGNTVHTSATNTEGSTRPSPYASDDDPDAFDPVPVYTTEQLTTKAQWRVRPTVTVSPVCKLELALAEQITSPMDESEAETVLGQYRPDSVQSTYEKSWQSRVENTRWVDHLRSVLAGAMQVAECIGTVRCHALVHCSDGWDRTAQVTSLAMLLLDPYYRTIEGFITLIEKEWLAAGHRFSTRCRHIGGQTLQAEISGPTKFQQISGFRDGDGTLPDAGEDDGASSSAALAYVGGDEIGGRPDDQQVAPVFLQWLDAVYQCTQQHPTLFEFNEEMLLYIAYHVYSCRYGTFIFDCERERNNSNMAGRTSRVWDELLDAREMFVNSEYAPVEFDLKGRRAFPRIACQARSIRLWSGFWLQHLAAQAGL
ncbi:Phosphoinositide 3-phosphatase-like protein [Carpediemonas membranifera]|uniref:Phosphoinositide 3-phosphatase-like protein n=1 Tax=Carpediemonas membranifera TaxID=201153 RepID=A0A8J6E5T2_9EUKA|nr:Phosphoinositide 3-phosphatase-like protein [Carpediemonas membranifera]|eukprot:KAG9396262.1 Phosphoinositide 3-phosphatase-like protein [Carpediemonas membranifera]